MTPQEKADSLFRKMYEVRTVAASDISKYFAKQCALIAVDEILQMGIMAQSGEWNMAKEYWEQVKQEIEKI
jgi:hypothetical protein